MKQLTNTKELSIPEHSFVLLDTNVLIDTTKYPADFQYLHAELKRLSIQSIIEHTIKFEFLRGLKDVKAGEQLLNELCGLGHVTLVPSQDIFERALVISDIYMKSDNKYASLADTLIAAQMCRYARDKKGEYEMYLATQNHRDFPPVLFERVDDMLLTLHDGNIKVIGFYRFRKDVFSTYHGI